MMNRIFSMIAISNGSDKIDPMLSLSVFVVVICGVKFLFEGVSVAIGEHTLSLGHVDPAAYAALLTPVLGAHGYTAVRSKPEKGEDK